jgi:hypothetical protein
MYRWIRDTPMPSPRGTVTARTRNDTKATVPPSWMSSAENPTAITQATRIATLIRNLARSLVSSSPAKEPISNAPPTIIVITPYGSPLRSQP